MALGSINRGDNNKNSRKTKNNNNYNSDEFPFTIPSSEIEFFKLKFEQLIDDVNVLKKGQEKLNSVILGDTTYRQEGVLDKIKTQGEYIDEFKKKEVLEKVSKHDEYIEKDKTFKAKLIGGGVVITAISTFLSKFWDKFF